MSDTMDRMAFHIETMEPAGFNPLWVPWDYGRPIDPDTWTVIQHQQLELYMTVYWQRQNNKPGVFYDNRKQMG